MLILAMLQAGGAPRGGPGFEDLFREFYEPMVAFFRKRGCSFEQSQELAQDTFLRAHQSFESFRAESKSSTWLFTIAINLWRNVLRDGQAAKRAGDEVSLAETPLDPPADGSPHEEAVGSERRRLLKDAIEELPDQMRRCVTIRVYQERSYGEIADLLEISVASAKSQVSRAKERLRSKLSDHYPELERLLEDS